MGDNTDNDGGAWLLHKEIERRRQKGEYGANQSQVADIVGCAPAHICLIVNGKRTPSLRVAVEIEHHMDVPCSSWIW